ncbi:PilZ domain-containing protein [Vibrio maerlii]|uniref:PilZ domain-containing protein n=1 Tax=Vibrio maerlii TaxID=2231648 RepID=UPI000E3C59BC|nr:PilZ domain-containing protein [Vibrio maerlii]
MIERRKFSRISFEAPASIQQGSTTVSGTVRDLSLHGLLVSSENASQLSQEQGLTASVMLNDSEVSLTLTGQLVAALDKELHIRIDKIDLDSIAHLRRLVELNMADEELLNRDLESLIALGSN